MDTIKKLSDYSLLNGSNIRFMGVQRPLIMTWQLQTIHLVTEVLQNTSVPLQRKSSVMVWYMISRMLLS
mgnify:CR=1 FL=1